MREKALVPRHFASDICHAWLQCGRSVYLPLTHIINCIVKNGRTGLHGKPLTQAQDKLSQVLGHFFTSVNAKAGAYQRHTSPCTL